MKKMKKKTNLKETIFEYKLNGTYVKVHGYHISKNGEVYRKRKYSNGKVFWVECKKRINVVANNAKYERFSIILDTGESRPAFVHYVMAQIYVPGYKSGLVCDHLDGNSLNNKLSNLHWVTRGENVSLAWNKLSEEEKQKRIKSFSDGVRKGHENGNYDKHLNKLHDDMRARFDSKAQNRQNFELLDGSSINTPSEEEMLKMAEYFKEDNNDRN